MKRTWAATAVAMIVSTVGAGCGDDEDTAVSVQMDAGVHDSGAPAVTIDGGGMDAQVHGRTPGPPPEVVAAAKEWPNANRDYAGTRSTFDSTIKGSNVATLTQAWTFELPGGGTFGAATAAPVVLNGVVYYVDMQSNVFAIDAKTGKQKWAKMYQTPGSGPNGVAVGWGKVFAPSSDHEFVALDINTGNELWKAPIVVPKNGGIGIAPIAYDELVYLSTVPVSGTSNYLGGVNGTFYALDQATGAIVWSFATVQDSDLWGHSDINSGGGAWYPPTIDVERDVMYWGVGNPAPYPGTDQYPNGSSHPGDNLYTSSVVALGRADGKLRWYYQDRPHDMFDLDFQNPPIPVSVSIGGVTRHLVIGSGKSGNVVGLDADRDGGVLWRTPVGKHQNDNVTVIPDAGVTVFPGDLGGVETPLAYADGTAYVAFCDQGRQFFPNRSGALDDEGTGGLVAIDVSTGAVKWKKELPLQTYGSVTIVNDVVFVPTLDGKVYFYNRVTGDEVWTFMSPIGINAAISVADDQVIMAAGAGIGVPQLIALKLP